MMRSFNHVRLAALVLGAGFIVACGDKNKDNATTTDTAERSLPPMRPVHALLLAAVTAATAAVAKVSPTTLAASSTRCSSGRHPSSCCSRSCRTLAGTW